MKRIVWLLIVLGVVLAACAAPTPQVVKETVVVPQTKVVEKVVEQTKVVEKVVTVTPAPTVPAKVTHIRFTLDFAIQGPQAPFLVALDKGYFAEEGLSVVLDRGLGSADAVTKIASGVYQMGYADINTLMEFNVKNPDKALQVVAIVLDRAPFSVLTLKGRGIEKPKDLEGKKLGAPAGDAPRRLFPVFAKAAGIDATKVTWVTMDVPLREPTLIKGDVDAITGFYFTAFLNLTANKVPASDIIAFQYSDYGLDLYGNGVMASPAWIEKNPDAVRAFLRGLVKGWKDTIANPDEAIAILLKREPLLDKDVEKQRLLLAIQNNMLTPDVKKNGFGGVVLERLAKAIDAVAAGFELPSKPDAAKLFTDKYLPPQADRMPPVK
ncbi:MAG: ABC transporter substrate-binding protein [Anaerolineae bacterium]|nr:ABC transporter substrate-binding protein [Anaerolineae bacterium]